MPGAGATHGKDTCYLSTVQRCCRPRQYHCWSEVRPERRAFTGNMTKPKGIWGLLVAKRIAVLLCLR